MENGVTVKIRCHALLCILSATFAEVGESWDRKILGILPCQATGTLQPIRAPNPLLIMKQTKETEEKRLLTLDIRNLRGRG